MPDSNGSVRLSVLNSFFAEHFWAFVEFPIGWCRLNAGYYSVAEDFFILKGELSINHRIYKPLDFGFIAANSLREETHSLGGALVLARFYGRPRWQSVSDNNAFNLQHEPKIGNALIHCSELQNLAECDCLGQGSGFLIYAHAGLSNWLVDLKIFESLQSSDVHMDCFNLALTPGSAHHFHASGGAKPTHWVCLPLLH